MKFSLFSSFFTFSALTVSTVEAQFGVGKKGRPGSSFQELNEQAKNAGGIGDLGDLDAMMKQMGIDADEMAKFAEEFGASIPDMDEVMKMMADMTPEELAKQMQDAMDLFSGEDMMANMLGNQDEILAMLEETGAVDAEELAKFKADPEYFEQKMKESMEQMREMMADPELLANAAQGMKAAQDLYNNPGAMNDMMADIMKELSDEDIEEVRQMFVGGSADPMMKELLGSIDTKELDGILNDPVEWRKAVKEGLGMFSNEGNKLVGEL